MSRTFCFNVPPNGSNGECVKKQTNKQKNPPIPQQNRAKPKPQKTLQMTGKSRLISCTVVSSPNPREPTPTCSPPLVLRKFVAKRFCAQEIKQISVSPLWFLRLISCSLTPWTSEAVLSYHTQVEVSVVGTVLEKKRN